MLRSVPKPKSSFVHWSTPCLCSTRHGNSTFDPIKAEWSSGCNVNDWFAESQQQFWTKIAINKNIFNKSIFQCVSLWSTSTVERSIRFEFSNSVTYRFCGNYFTFFSRIFYFACYFERKNLVLNIIYLYLIASNKCCNFFLMRLVCYIFSLCVISLVDSPLCYDFIVFQCINWK